MARPPYQNTRRWTARKNLELCLTPWTFLTASRISRMRVLSRAFAWGEIPQARVNRSLGHELIITRTDRICGHFRNSPRNSFPKTRQRLKPSFSPPSLRGAFSISEKERILYAYKEMRAAGMRAIARSRSARVTTGSLA